MNVPCGPINNIEQVFKDPQVISRKMQISMNHKKSKKKIKLIGSPIKLLRSPVKYNKPPPLLGEDTEKILKKFLKLNNKDIQKLKNKKII